MADRSSSSAERDKRTVRVGNALRAMTQWAETARDRAAKRGNLHPTDFGCIGYLYRQQEPVSPKQIIAYLGLSSGSGTALLDRLEQVGYIRRLPNPHDRRGVLIALDREAAHEPISLYLKVEQSFRRVIDSLSDSDLDTVAAFLEQIGQLSFDIDAPQADQPEQAE